MAALAARVFSSAVPIEPPICCMVLTIAVSLATRPNKEPAELKGLVYSLTPRILSDNEAWYLRPAVLGVLVLLAVLALNLIFA